MANAKQCDRCGRLFNPLQTEFTICRFRNPVFQNRKNVKEGTVLGYLIPDEGPDAWVDLCVSCAEDFESFMNNMPLAVYHDPPICEKDFEHTKAMDQLDKDFNEITKRDLMNNWVTGYKYRGGEA